MAGLGWLQPLKAQPKASSVHRLASKKPYSFIEEMTSSEKTVCANGYSSMQLIGYYSMT